MGALSAAVVGYMFDLPHVLHVLSVSISCINNWIIICYTSIIRMYFKTSELIITLMLNFIASFNRIYNNVGNNGRSTSG